MKRARTIRLRPLHFKCRRGGSRYKPRPRSGKNWSVPTLSISSLSLNPAEVRVLGSLIEKEITTPETYPLSLNALVNAANQRSSREPVMDLGEEDVRQALHRLEQVGLVSVARDARVAKFEHHARTLLNLRRDETALLCLLLLRGPQTPGELRSRADRLYAFDGLDAVETALRRLAERPADPVSGDPSGATGPAVLQLLRQPGSREARWAHLLGGSMEAPAPAHPGPSVEASSASVLGSGTSARLAALEAEVIRLSEAVARLERKLP